MKKIMVLSGLFFLLSSISFSQVKTNFTKQNYSKFFKEDCIPKDLTANGHILLVQTPYEEKETEKNNEIDEVFKTYYKSPYIIVPLKSKDFTKTYGDNKIYKYSVGFNKSTVKYGDGSDKMDVGHIHYELAIFDREKLAKSGIPAMPEGLSKKEKEKFYKELQKNKDDYKIDPTAIRSTGLEDNQSKLIEMLTFLVKKLGNYKEE